MGGRWSDGWYVVPHQAIFRDLDAIGHVNNAVFFTYFEWARALFWFDFTGAAGLLTSDSSSHAQNVIFAAAGRVVVVLFDWNSPR
jgi:hypothetical protein